MTETLTIGDVKWKHHEDVGYAEFRRPFAVSIRNIVYVAGKFNKYAVEEFLVAIVFPDLVITFSPLIFIISVSKLLFWGC